MIAASHADRVERFYLAVLRIFILFGATLCLATATFFALDGIRSWLTSTEVTTAKTVVSADDVLAEQASAAVLDESMSDDAIKEARKPYVDYLNELFSDYHAIYAGLARAYNKPEDKLLTRTELTVALGYDVSALVDELIKEPQLLDARREEDQQLIAALKAVSTNPKFTGILSKYKAARKTAQACRTTYRRQRGWDSGSMACDAWYERPVGCPVIRQVPVRKCEAAYPDNIKSPLAAVAEFDGRFRKLWADRTEQNVADASSRLAEKQALKASGPSKLMTSVYILAAFLTIMFFFLMIAIERHLRRLSAA